MLYVNTIFPHDAEKANKGRIMKARSCILAILVLTGTHISGNASRVTQHDPYPLYTAMYPYNFLSLNERRTEKGMDSIFDSEHFRWSVSALYSNADFSTTFFKEKNQPLFNLTGAWNVVGVFYNQSPVQPTSGTGPLELTPFQAFLAQKLDISTDLNTDEAKAFRHVIDPANVDSKQQFGFMDVPGEYRKYGLRTQIEALFFWGFGMRASTGVSDIRSTPCIAHKLPDPFKDTTESTELRRDERCDPLALSCEATGRECTVFDEDAGENRSARLESFTEPQKKLVLNKIIDQFDTLAKELGYDPSAYNETDIEDIDFQLYWRRPILINESRPQWPDMFVTPFLIGHATVPLADRVDPTKLFALAHGNNDFAAYGLSGGFSLDFVDMVQIAFDAGMTRFDEEHRTNIPVPTSPLQQGILPRTANANIKPGTNWSFGASLYAYYMYERLSFGIEYRLVHHTEDEVTFTSVNKLSDEQLKLANESDDATLVDKNGDRTTQDTFTLDDIAKTAFIERSKWESHYLQSSLTYEISPNISLGFLWQAPVHRRNAFKQTSLLWTIASTF